MSVIPFDRRPASSRHEACSRCSIGHLCMFEIDGPVLASSEDEGRREEMARIEAQQPVPTDCPIPF